MNSNSKRPRRRPHRCQEYAKEGILTPSDQLFKNISQEVSLNSLKEDVITCIRNREKLIDHVREILRERSKDDERGGSRIHVEAKSNQVKKLFYALHNASLCVVEAIITINLQSQSIECQQSSNRVPTSTIPSTSPSSRGEDLLSFSWIGQNYLIKMISDFQFICKFKEMMTIILPEKKTLYRNPFLIPLDLDEIMGYEPDVSCVSSKSKMTRMARIPWEINLKRVKRAASRILFEEHRAVYGDSNICHVFPKLINKRDGNYVDILLPPSPKLDPIELEKIVSSRDLCFDDALVIGCVRLFLGCDIEGVQVYQHCIPRESIFKLARQPIDTIFHELHIPESEVKVISIEKSILFSIYSMMTRNLFKVELLVTESSKSICSLKTWLFDVVSREWEIHGLSKGTQLVDPLEAVKREKILNDNKGVECSRENTEEKKETTKKEEMNKNAIDSGIATDNNCNGEKGSSEKKDLSPIPIWNTVHVKEGSHKVKLLQGKSNNSISVGDMIRIGHPHYSSDYTVSRIDDYCFYIVEAFNNSCLTRQKLDQQNVDKISRLYSPAKRSNKDDRECATSTKIIQRNDELNIEALELEKHKIYQEGRIWKLIPTSEDKRLEWRKEYDNGFVRWFPTAKSGCREHFNIRLNWKDVEEYCHDTTSNPDTSVHQQRLHYFEKVSLDDIVIETYNTVCQSWHPITPTINNAKWAKLARTMKFLSTVKNAHHEVDMAFFRHSNQRTLDIKRFKGVLLDMALQKYSSARYEGGEAFANMLWTTVVMLPQVNEMVWRKAQDMAVDMELRRVCAQIRISAQIRMYQQRKDYCRLISAAICVSKHAKRMIAMRKRHATITLAHYYRFYRIQHASATICQKYWRRYIQICRFTEQKKLRERNKEIADAELWQKLRMKGLEKKQYLIFRKVMNIQSVLTITSMSLRDKMNIGKGIELEIHVYVPQIRHTYNFFLNENEIRQSLEKFILRKGPLSWNEMLKHDILIKLHTRLVAKIVRGTPIIVFCRRDIAEKGVLIARKIFPFKGSMYILSLYRSPFDFVVRIYEPESREMLRTNISLSLLTDWLIEDENIRRKETLGVLKFCDLVRSKNVENDKVEYHSRKQSINHEDLPILLRRDKQPDLINWLIKRIQLEKDESSGKKKIVLQYEAEAEHMERVARKFQSIWRAKCAKVKAKRQVHLQFEKQFDWVSRSFFYVHIKSGTRQWTKPKLLSREEDIVDPPDEWREIVHRDPETDVLSLYYYNPLTGQTSWLSEYDAAKIVQRKFRKRQTELLLPSSMSFTNVVKAVTMINDTEIKYQQCPDKLSNRVNFALLCHCIRFDFDEARAHYKFAVAKSSHHPVISRAYGIFILATCKAPLTQTFEKACELFKQAQKIDPDQRMFESAKEHFFYWAVLMNPNHPLSLLNYALLHQCVLGEFYRAEKIYRQALSKDPTNELVADNYMLFQDQRYPGGYYAGSGVPHSIMKRSRVLEEKKDWGEWKRMIDPVSSKPNFSTFWYDTIDEVSSFDEPDWKEVWMKRVQRSRQISVSNKSLWVEYYDDKLDAVFTHNRFSGEFVWQQS